MACSLILDAIHKTVSNRVSFLLFQSNTSNSIWTIAIGAGIAFLAIVGGAILLIRRTFRITREEHQAPILATNPNVENPSSFMAASMQGVIAKLREQERELERLHKLEKERAEQSERLSEEVTRNMPAGLLVVNATGIISSANPAAEQTLGIRALVFRRYSEALGEKSDLTRLVGECLTSGKIFRREEVEHQPPLGDSRHLGVTISPIRRGEEKITGVICLLSDLTQLTALQRQVQLKDNLAALGELSAGIAHEFKNALATISGYAQMIQAEANVADVSDSASKILEQTRNITHVVTEFLKYARPLEISSEPVQLDSTMERVLSEVSEGNPRVRVRSEGQFGCVAGDEGLLRQAILNLVRNAAEACLDAPNGGRVILRGEIRTSDDGGWQRVTVFDNGPGITPAMLRKLFRPFFTTKANGTGLGLAVVQKIIVQHGGTVEAHNRQEGGAAFIVTLPLGRTSPEPAEAR
jgi:two-component system, NtrC family, sensor histidine kinase HydH